jgi:hypothetical protein
LSDTPTVYRIVSRVHVNKWDDALQQAVPGWDVRALWVRTGTVLPVFVPDTQYTPENIDQLVRAAGAKDDAIHALGG